MNLIELFKEYFLHLDKHLPAFVDAHGAWVYGLMFVIIFAETGLVVTPFLPGDSLLFLAGFVAVGSTVVNPALLILILAAAAILGDTVNYSAGHFIGPKVFKRPKSLLFNPEHLQRAHRFYEKYGGETIIIARFMPIIRTFAPFVAGIGRMSYARFISYNVIGGAGWVTLLVLAGYSIGRLQIVRDHLSVVTMVIIALSVMPAVIEAYRAWREKRQGQGVK
ncbi:MAG: DedA family protein [Candidatus Brocadiia bacterium]|jgi:membrane-associated protein